MREKRQEQHKSKRSSALANLSAKIHALGDDVLCDEYEAAAFLGKSVQSLRNYRIYGGSIPFIKVGAAVRYRLRDLKS